MMITVRQVLERSVLVHFPSSRPSLRSREKGTRAQTEVEILGNLLIQAPARYVVSSLGLGRTRV